MNMNDSKIWNMNSVIDAFKNLKELQKFPHKEPNSNTTVREWEDFQLK
jgi:hypothetical protein